ncbi:MAG: TerC family protein [Prevotella sp.]|nr:TerC family protein [Prevotella sp.]
MNSDIIPLWGWILFYALVLLMLAIDLKSFDRRGQKTHAATDGEAGAHEVSIREALQMTVVWIAVSLVFCAGIYFFYPIDPHQKALEFLSGYLIEKSLSVDNLFVFLMLFSFFGVERKYQHEVLFWGIIGALVLRSIFIFLGAAVVTRFEWVLAIFGVFLLYSGAKMFTHNEEAQPDPSRNIFVRIFRRFFPVTNEMHGGKFFVREITSSPSLARGGWKGAFTPLFVALIVIETSDIAFAVDSIPAVFSVTQDPFIVLTSNIFAILGLRALYFALAAIAKYFAYLKYGLGIVLIFVGIKLLLHCHLPYVPHIEIRTGLSLLIIFGTITLSILASVVRTRSQSNSESF